MKHYLFIAVSGILFHSCLKDQRSYRQYDWVYSVIEKSSTNEIDTIYPSDTFGIKSSYIIRGLTHKADPPQDDGKNGKNFYLYVNDQLVQIMRVPYKNITFYPYQNYSQDSDSDSIHYLDPVNNSEILIKYSGQNDGLYIIDYFPILQSDHTNAIIRNHFKINYY